MSFEVEILADSVSGTAPHRLTTMRVKCPAMIHQEQLRHRAHSFSVSSMRAIPIAKQIQRVRDDPAMPAEWTSERPGMVGGAHLSPEDIDRAHTQWLVARNAVIERVLPLVNLGLHKGVASRLLQPWSHYEMVITSCAPGWKNYFALRCHEAADPTIRRLAVRQADAYRNSVPQSLRPGGWHLPYVIEEEWDRVWCLSIQRRIDEKIRDLIKYSVARCARVSFLRHGMDHSEPDKDIVSHDRFIASGHWSTLEHQAQMPLPGEDIRGLEGNLPGVKQYRQMVIPNVHREFDFSILDREFSGDLA